MDVKVLTKWAGWTGAGSGVVVPSLTFFINMAPPMFPYIAFIVTAISGGVTVIIYNYKKETKKDTYTKKSIWFIVIALFCVVLYAACFQLLTIKSPDNARYQIGFRGADWSLTESAKDYLISNPGDTIDEWMLDFGAYKENGPQKIWTIASIHLASTFLILLLLVSFVTWSIGFALLSKKTNANNVALK